MDAFSLIDEQVFDPKKHVEKILRDYPDGDVTVACWEPGQISPNHCHPNATEIYFCFQGGGVMRTPDRTIEIKPGAFVVHPPGELHEYANGTQRSLRRLECRGQRSDQLGLELSFVAHRDDSRTAHLEATGSDFRQTARLVISPGTLV